MIKKIEKNKKITKENLFRISEILKESILSNWKTFFISLIASLLATSLTALILIEIFRVPNFSVSLKYTPVNEKGVEKISNLDIRVKNKKRWLGFKKEEIRFGLLIPSAFMENKEIYINIPLQSSLKMELDKQKEEVVNFNNTNYYHIKEMVYLPIHPDSVVTLLSIRGNFDYDKNVKICCYLSTPYGRYPNNIEIGETGIIEAEDLFNKIPCAEIFFD